METTDGLYFAITGNTPRVLHVPLHLSLGPHPAQEVSSLPVPKDQTHLLDMHH